ncbi:VanZ family protein [Candidatus Parcubacteria bacterium]|nr:VanZ family protein [Candidatus Parcubacteria bacterium]
MPSGRRLEAWGLVLLWAGLIFIISSTPDAHSGLEQDFFLRKVAHMVEFGVLAWLLGRAFKAESVKPKNALAGALVFAVIYALSDEWHQTFISGREGAWRDVGFDALGAIVALVAVYGRDFLASSTT